MEYRYDPILCMNVPFGKAKDASKVVLYSSRTRKYVGKNMQYTDNKNDAKTFNSMVEAYKFVDDNYADGHSIKAVVLDSSPEEVCVENVKDAEDIKIIDKAIETISKGLKYDKHQLAIEIRTRIEEENDAINAYEAMLSHVSEPRFRDVIADISNEEKVHIGELTKILNEIDPDNETKFKEGYHEND